ncbi:hypothetical protein AXA65_11180 [Chryseobacterium sp. FP211-J200]|nr:hypothetical protein AXA65_11180 [Chryseobacterium sp. FP211-J200]
MLFDSQRNKSFAGYKSFIRDLGQNVCYAKLQPGLNGALFVIAITESSTVMVSLRSQWQKSGSGRRIKLPKYH